MPDLRTPTLETSDLTVRFGGHVAVDGVSCAFNAGELTAIVGPNGAGKTTYFNLISGQIACSAGRVLLHGQDITSLPIAARSALGVGRAFQLTNLFPSLTVQENIRLVVQARRGRGFQMWSLAESHKDLTEATETVLERVRLTHVARQPITALSHGDQRKVEVAVLIAMEPRVFMFDEPTAGMALEESPMILDLISGIKANPDVTVLLVEHKLDVIHSLADRIVVLHNGALVADGPPSEVMASKVVQEAYLGRELSDA